MACSIIDGTSSGFLKISTISMDFWSSSGILRRFLQLFSPRISEARGFTGMMR
jgi:hypothetical protein